MSETVLSSGYDSDYDIFDLTFCTVEAKLLIPGQGEELNVEQIKKMFGQDNSPIPKSLVILNS